MGIYKSFAGTVTVELTSASAEDCLRRITDQGIPVFDARSEGNLTLSFSLYQRDLPKLMYYAERIGDQIKIVHRGGLYWSMLTFLKRPVLILGLFFILFLALYIPSRVLFVSIEGNTSIPAKLIIESAKESGIRFGASRRKVRSEKMKNSLLSRMPQLQWAGVNTYGCTAVITVREREMSESSDEKQGVSSIVAARDGVILSSTVTSGNNLCVPGQAVKQGQVLISGYTDCGISICATRAQGEILALTNHNLKAITPSSNQLRTSFQKEDVKYSLIIGKKRINFYKGSGISDSSCVKMYSKCVLTLPGGFELPVTLVRESITSCSTKSSVINQTAAESMLSAFAAEYLKSHMIAGSILERAQMLTLDQDVYCLIGHYACSEMIGREQAEQIGEYHGKTD